MTEQKFGGSRGSVVLDDRQQAAFEQLQTIPGLIFDLDVYEGDHPLMPADDGDWTIMLRPVLQGGRPSREGWLNYEWFIWYVSNALGGNSKDAPVKVSVFSAAPYLNEPGSTMRLWIEGNRTKITVEDFIERLLAEFQESKSDPEEERMSNREIHLMAQLMAGAERKTTSEVPSVPMTDKDFENASGDQD